MDGLFPAADVSVRRIKVSTDQLIALDVPLNAADPQHLSRLFVNDPWKLDPSSAHRRLFQMGSTLLLIESPVLARSFYSDFV